MVYLFNENAGKEIFSVKGEDFKYLIKVRRHCEGDEIAFRAKDEADMLYIYKLIAIEPRSALFELISCKNFEVKAKKELHIAWCVIDNKSVEKVLPSLNELGVCKISFIYCDRSQKNFKPDFKRYARIVEASNQQCGRTQIMEFDSYKNIEDFIAEVGDVRVFDFCENVLEDGSDFGRVLIGCEGGFSPREKEFLINQEVFRLDTPMILRSETATVAVASKILL